MVNVLLKEQVIGDIIGDRKLEEDGKYECDQCYNNCFVLFCFFTLGLSPCYAWVILSGVGLSMDRHVTAEHQDPDMANSKPLLYHLNQQSDT